MAVAIYEGHRCQEEDYKEDARHVQGSTEPTYLRADVDGDECELIEEKHNHSQD